MAGFLPSSSIAAIATELLLLLSSIASSYANPPPKYTAEFYRSLPHSSKINNINITNSNFVSALNHLFFIHHNELYTLDNNGGVGVSSMNIRDGKGVGYTNFGRGDASYAVLKDALYFFASGDYSDDGSGRLELIKTDGTVEGTAKVSYVGFDLQNCCMLLVSMFSYCNSNSFSI